MADSNLYTAFEGNDWMTTADLASVLKTVKAHGPESVLLFEERTGKQCDFDFRGTLAEILARIHPPTPKPGPGRPKLGVLSREISLLPRHWQWLELQPHGASAALRRLVDLGIQNDSGATEFRLAVEALGKIMTAIAGNQEGFEEAMRHLYAHRFEELKALIAQWPGGIRTYVKKRLAVISCMPQ